MQPKALGNGNARRETPLIFRDLRDDLAVEICHEMKRRGWTTSDLVALGYSKRMCRMISEYLRASPNDRFGAYGAADLAARLGIPIRILIGRSETAGISIRQPRRRVPSRPPESVAA